MLLNLFVLLTRASFYSSLGGGGCPQKADSQMSRTRLQDAAGKKQFWLLESRSLSINTLHKQASQQGEYLALGSKAEAVPWTADPVLQSWHRLKTFHLLVVQLLSYQKLLELAC